MSCPHGVWHEEDCEICTMVDNYQSRISELEEQRDAIMEALRAYLNYHIADDSRCSEQAWLALASVDEAIAKAEGEAK